MNQKFDLHFSAVRSRATKIFNSNLTTWKEKLFEKFNLQKQLQPASSPLLGDGRKLFRSVLHSLRWAYALSQASYLENWQNSHGRYPMNYRHYHQRDPIKNYFPLPNEIFSLGLSFGEIAVYAYLMYCEDRQTYQCYPSYKTIGDAIDMSRNTVAKYVKDLEGKQFITTEPTRIHTRDGRTYNGNLRYTIRPIEDAINYFHECQGLRH